VIAGVDSGSVGRQPNRDDWPLDGVLTTTRDLRPSLIMVERDASLVVIPLAGTSQTGPDVTALGMMVVPGGQPCTPPAGVP
jgi:hypothetical protein